MWEGKDDRGDSGDCCHDVVVLLMLMMVVETVEGYGDHLLDDASNDVCCDRGWDGIMIRLMTGLALVLVAAVLVKMTRN